jgi:two-component sensor histidine kinase
VRSLNTAGESPAISESASSLKINASLLEGSGASPSGTSDILPDAMESILDGIANGTPDLIAAEDRDFRYTFFNAAYAREFRTLWGKELRLGTSMVDAMAPWPDEQRKARELWTRALAGETFSVVQSFGPSEAESRTYDLRFSPVRDRDGVQIGAAHIVRDVTEEVRLQKALSDALAQRQLILEELDHRIKNLLTMVQAMAHQSLRGSDVPAAARTAFMSRLSALARAQEIVLRHGDAPVGITALAQTVLSPFGFGDRIRAEGPDLLLPGRAAVSLALALHELATNAVKHGALSTDGGHVDLAWALVGPPGSGAIRLTWREGGGPLVVAPDRRGYGLRLVEQSLPLAFGGPVRIDFAPGGLCCIAEGTIAAS